MTVFPSLPVLESVALHWAAEDRQRLGQVWFVCCQHLLETTGSLFEVLIRLGAAPSHVFIVGKVYSTHLQTAARMRSLGINVRDGTRAASFGQFDRAIGGDVHAMWKDALAAGALEPPGRMVVLDDGGYCARTMPGNVIAARRCVVVEQTSSGMAGASGNGTWQTPVVAVATSAAKRLLEAPLVVDAVLRRLERFEHYRSGMSVGILGLGALGCALLADLRSKGIPVCAFDSRPQAMRPATASEARASAELLIRDSGLVVGCSGERSVQAEWIPRRQTPLVLASASSSDREFADVLERWADAIRLVGKEQSCPDLVIPRIGGQCPVTLLRSGFPVNFDNSHESVPQDQIQLTRGLLLAGVLQAMRMAFRERPRTHTIMLDAEVQRSVVRTWLDAGGKADPTVAQCFHDLKWVRQESGGDEDTRL